MMRVDENVWAVVLIALGAFICWLSVHDANDKLFGLGEGIVSAGMIAFKGNQKSDPSPTHPAGPAQV